MLKLMLQLHRWLGLLFGVLILIAAGTVIGLNHRDVFARPETGEPRSPTPYDHYVLSAAVNPDHPDTALVGTHAGLFRTDEGGRSWSQVALPVSAEQVGAVLFDNRSPGVAYALLRYRGLYRSDPSGTAWQAISTSPSLPAQAEFTGLSQAADGRLLVTTSEGLCMQDATLRWQWVPGVRKVSEDQGKKWVKLMYDLHDGQIWGPLARTVTDGVAVAMIGLVLSGFSLCLARLRTCARPASEKS